MAIFANDIMVKKVVTVKESLSVKKACSLLTKSRLSGVPVLSKSNKLVGFVSERDLIKAMEQPRFLSKKVKDVMTKKVVYVKEDTPVEEISKIFALNKFRFLPVVKKGKVVGVLARNDVMSRLLGHYY